MAANSLLGIRNSILHAVQIGKLKLHTETVKELAALHNLTMEVIGIRNPLGTTRKAALRNCANFSILGFFSPEFEGYWI